jgi:hypothetical protein
MAGFLIILMLKATAFLRWFAENPILPLLTALILPSLTLLIIRQALLMVIPFRISLVPKRQHHPLPPPQLPQDARIANTTTRIRSGVMSSNTSDMDDR